MKKEIIKVDKLPKPSMPYSHCVKAGNLLFTAGTVGIDPATNKLLRLRFSYLILGILRR